MLKTMLKTFMDFFWDKFILWLVSIFKEKQIESEVDNEENEIKQIRKEIKQHVLQTGDTKIPPELEKRMRDAVRRRNDRMPNGL